MAAEPLLSAEEKATEKVRFGNFEVVNDSEGRPVLLGKGTFGRTYQARHCFLDIIVALKIITERYVADAAVRQRFLTEARAVAKLSHPHIARLYDFGEKVRSDFARREITRSRRPRSIQKMRKQLEAARSPSSSPSRSRQLMHR